MGCETGLKKNEERFQPVPRIHPSATISPESPPAIEGESVERYTARITTHKPTIHINFK
jgi:hypothetical protein